MTAVAQSNVILLMIAEEANGSAISTIDSTLRRAMTAWRRTECQPTAPLYDMTGKEPAVAPAA
ncbi:hypothetical protein [Sphingomonas sp. ERG5]|uniref:hypothetical protein n=1 Tax=Sphingomonas sp. ERG5 TaxID=1381597 RepID=UPI001364A9C4|nr:hypothetical protein [Sphingomonas sp. ERG5]